MGNEIKSKQKTYIILTVLLYWLVFWILPSYFLNPFTGIFRVLRSINFITRLELEGFVYYYFIIAPLLSFLPYKILKKLIPDFRYNAVFFIVTIIIPFIFGSIYSFVYLPSIVDIGGGFGI